MKLKILSGVCLGEGVDAFEGEIHEVTDVYLSQSLLARGAAKVYEEEPGTADEDLATMKASELLAWASAHGIALDMVPQVGAVKILAAIKSALSPEVL